MCYLNDHAVGFITFPSLSGRMLGYLTIYPEYLTSLLLVPTRVLSIDPYLCFHVQLLNWALEPASDEILDDFFEMGYKDALVWVTNASKF